MLYTDLGKISLRRFIDIYCGDLEKTVERGKHSPEEMKEAAGRLCGAYLSIVGGKSALAEVHRRDEMLRSQMRLQVLQGCRAMMGYGDMEGVCRVMGVLGYAFKPEQEELVARRMESIRATEKFRLERMRNAMPKAPGGNTGREYFVRERVAVMSWAKMHIDPEVFTAEEYAWLVKRMCDELEYVNRQKNKTK